MTAEIAVFNSSGIALAADSAVTISQNNMVKINNSANKLFELCKGHPVGVMIFNNASLAGSPWELLIKSFRQASTGPEDTIEKYTNSLIAFLQSNKHIIPDHMRMKSAQNLFARNLSEVNTLVNNVDFVSLIKQNKPNVNILDFYQCLENRLDDEIRTLEGNAYYPSIDDTDYPEVIQYVEGYAQEVYVQIIPIDASVAVPASLHDKLIHFAALIVCKQSQKNRNYTGIVLAGYGEIEYYPAIKSLHIYGLFKEKLLYTIDNEKSKSSDPFQASILPFAQEEEVVTFIEGCSKNVNKFTNELALELIGNFRKNAEGFLSDKIDPSLLDECTRSFEASQQTLFDIFLQKKQAFISNNHVTKMLSMLDSLGKVDLAYMAESLIDITAFKRKITNDHETVGGPVDVAVISKGDGFVWIKRKHYFPKELNTSFFNRP